MPFAAALAIAVIGARFFLFSRLPLGWWFYLTWQTPLTPRFLISELLLRPDSRLNTAFWSLRYEVQLSIVFPFLLLALRKIGLWGSLASGFFAYCVSLYLQATRPDFHYYQETLRFGSLFLIGAALASRRDAWRRMWLLSLGGVQAALILTGVVLYFWGEKIAIRLQCPKFDDLLVATGASILILSAIGAGQFGVLLRSKVPEYLGRVSYSMYLVHGTVLFVLLNLLYGKVPTLALALIYIVATFAASQAFCKWIEEPSLQWGKRLAVGRPAARA